MQVLGQGLVLMVAGMGIVFAFLIVMIFVCKYSSAFVSRYANIIPDDAPKAAPKKAAATSADADIALAIAVALNR